MSEEKEVMWVEKYRPKALDEVIDHKEVVAHLKQLLKDPSTMPHLLFAGPPGNGKTSVALCIARQLFGKNWRDLTLELNASDERGIPMVRERIKTYARLGTIGEAPYRLIILDESDQMTSEAQTALRRIMETSSRTARFILICNYSSKIIEPIQSRCAIFRFSELQKDDVAGCLNSIAKKEGAKVNADGIDAIWDFCRGDLRRAINTLQAAAVLGKAVSEGEVRKVVGRAGPEEVRTMLKQALTGKFTEARDKLYEILITRGVAGADLIRQIHKEVFTLGLSEEEVANLANMIGEYEFRLTEGANEDIQLSALLAQFAALKRGSK